MWNLNSHGSIALPRAGQGQWASLLSQPTTLLHTQGETDDRIAHLGISRWGGACLAALWLLLLSTVLYLVHSLDYDHRRDATPLDWFEVFFR